MNKKLQVFVSSTYTDLIEERQAAVQAILDAGHIPAGMELFKAGKSQMKTIQKWIDDSDVYMLILGGRYGSIEEESGLSYTELEYNYAISKNIPVFAIVLDEKFLHIKAASCGNDEIFEKDNINKYKEFKSWVMSKIVKTVNDISKIESIIHATLNDILTDEEYQLIGWVKDNSLQTQSIDFKSLTKILKSFNFNNTLTAYDFFLTHISQFSRGISKSYCPNTYRYHSRIFLLNNILQSIEDYENGEEILRLSKFGADYYNYVILHEQ